LQSSDRCPAVIGENQIFVVLQAHHALVVVRGRIDQVPQNLPDASVLSIAAFSDCFYGNDSKWAPSVQ
jgi:hypothetical protein